MDLYIIYSHGPWTSSLPQSLRARVPLSHLQGSHHKSCCSCWWLHLWKIGHPRLAKNLSQVPIHIARPTKPHPCSEHSLQKPHPHNFWRFSCLPRKRWIQCHINHPAQRGNSLPEELTQTRKTKKWRVNLSLRKGIQDKENLKKQTRIQKLAINYPSWSKEQASKGHPVTSVTRATTEQVN